MVAKNLVSLPSCSSGAPHPQPDVAFSARSLEGGGAERVLVNLANQLAADGAIVDVVLVEACGPYLGLLSDRVRLIDLNRNSSLGSAMALAKYLRAERPKSVVACMESSAIAAALAAWWSRSDARLYMWEHITPSVHFAMTKKWKERVLPPFVRAAYRRADGVIAVSKGCADDVHKTYKVPLGQIITIPNPIRIEEIRGWASEPISHPWFGGSNPVFLGAGRLTEQKNFPALIRAFAEVRRVRDVRLVILGQGPLETSLRELVASLGLTDFVDLPGYVKNPFAYMARADAFVLSSFYEALPTVLLEALVCGANVVSTNCPTGPEEILDGGKHGILVPPNSDAELAHGMLQALDSPRPKMPEAALAAYRSDHIGLQFRRLLLETSL